VLNREHGKTIVIVHPTIPKARRVRAGATLHLEKGQLLEQGGLEGRRTRHDPERLSSSPNPVPQGARATILTLLSVIMAFPAVRPAAVGETTIFQRRRGFRRRPRVLMVQGAGLSFTSPLPISMAGPRPRGDSPGVARRRLPASGSAAVWQQNTPPDHVFASIRSVIIADVYSRVGDGPTPSGQAFANTRTGMIVGKQLAEQFGWKIRPEDPDRPRTSGRRKKRQQGLDLRPGRHSSTARMRTGRKRQPTWRSFKWIISRKPTSSA